MDNPNELLSRTRKVLEWIIKYMKWRFNEADLAGEYSKELTEAIQLQKDIEEYEKANNLELKQ